MSKENTFKHVYSAAANQEVQSIREKYLPHEQTQLEKLMELDAGVKRPASIFAYIYGSVGAVIMGAGMSLIMTDIGKMLGMTNVIVPGVIVGLVGMYMALSTYPIYKKMLGARKKKFAPQILEFSEKILKG